MIVLQVFLAFYAAGMAVYFTGRWLERRELRRSPRTLAGLRAELRRADERAEEAMRRCDELEARIAVEELLEEVNDMVEGR